MKILLLGINYAPEVSGIAPYTTTLAQHLATEHDVTVITGLPHYPEWNVAAPHRAWRKDESCGGVRVIRLRHFVPRHPNALSRAIYELTWSLRALASGLSLKPDIVIAIVPALFGAYAARVIARRRRAPFGVLVHDVMSSAAAQSGYRGGRLLVNLTALLERSYLTAADSIATIHPQLAKELARLTNFHKQPAVIYNWTHVGQIPEEADLYRAAMNWPPEVTVALHTGNMGSKQNLETVIDAARMAFERCDPIHFVLCGSGSARGALISYASGLPNVQIIESVASDQYGQLLAAADVLIVNERPAMRDMSLPSKLTSYFAAGRPIVAATEAGSATADFVARSGGGVVTSAGHAGDLLAAINRLRREPEFAQQLGHRGKLFACQQLSQPAALRKYDRWIVSLGMTRGE